MRKTFGYLLVLAIISISSPLSASGTDASPSSAPLITEVDPGCEGFTLGNYGSSAIDLRGYSITDGEGTLTFVSSFILSPGGSVTVSKSTGACWFDSRPGVLTYPSDIIAKNRTFILADAGDELSLRNGSSVIDSVCYGKSQGVENGTATLSIQLPEGICCVSERTAIVHPIGYLPNRDGRTAVPKAFLLSRPSWDCSPSLKAGECQSWKPCPKHRNP
jgi:hypothetical protein